MVCAGKWWGRRQEQPILAFHGLGDSAASFDLLARHLDVPAFLALDLPGHGLSSHFPKGMTHSWGVMMSAIRYLLKYHFKWPVVRLLGHSYGSCVALTYAGLYPSETQVLITIDCARAAYAVRDYLDIWQRNTDVLLSLDFETRQTFSYQEALSSISARGYLTEEQSQLVASRSLSNVGCGRYVFNEDVRMSSPSIGGNTLGGLDALVDNITSNVLNVVASNGILVGDFMDIIEKHNEIMAERCQHFECRVIKGPHQVHMDNPLDVASAINEFVRTIDLS